MTDVKTPEAESFTYKAEMQQLLDLIIHSLYQHKDIFLRELISNASDALNKVRFQKVQGEDVFDADAELKIEISVDKEANTLTISDSGIGMTRDELIANLGTIANSGTKNFLKALKEQQAEDDKNLDAQNDLIGQFGVGFYSAFMVADNISVETRSSAPDATAFRWESNGGNDYKISTIDKETRGTTITLHLKDDDKDFAEDFKIRQTVRKYSNYVAYPIMLGEDKLNETEAIWTKPSRDVTEEQYNEFYKFTSMNFDEPLLTIHRSVETPVQYHALLYIPGKGNYDRLFGKETRNIKLFCRKVFVHDEDTGLIPPYLRFVTGVVDSEDFPLNVSREVVQSNPLISKLSKSLTNRVLSEIEKLAEKEPEKFKTFWTEFGRVFKEGLHTDFQRKDRLTKLLHFQTSTQEDGTLHTFADYVSRMKEGQKEIYFVSGESRKAAVRKPKMEIFNKHDVEVLLFLDPIDEFIIQTVGKFEDLEIKEIEQADISWLEDSEESKVEPVKPEFQTALIEKMKETLKDRVEDVRTGERLISSPCVLVAKDGGMSAHMERVMKMMNDSFAGDKRVLEINPRNAIIKVLAQLVYEKKHEELVNQGIEQLFANVQLLDGELKEPQDMIQRDHTFMERAFEALLGE